jgi:hypothetical protein
VLRPYVGITMAEVKPSRMAQLRTACPGGALISSMQAVVLHVCQ